MLSYIIRRLLLVFPTLLGALLVTFSIVQLAPGGPVDQIIARLQGEAVGAAQSFSTLKDDVFSQAQTGSDNKIYQGAYGLDPEYIKELEKQFGFDKPVHERFLLLAWNYLRFDFGESYFRNTSVVDLIIEKLPVSISLGLWMTLLSYGISIPLGIRKAVRDGSRFDVFSSSIIIVAYAIPGFVLAVFLIILFSGGSFFTIFPLGGLVSENFDQLPWYGKIIDYFWHLTLPIIVMSTSAFAVTTFLTKNSFVDEISKKYVMTARAKGLEEKQILYKHVFRNAMLIIVSGFPGAFVGAFFTSSLLIEKTFSLDGLGLLGFEAIVSRDYAIVFASLYIFGLIGLVINLISDITYVIIDPRIDFETREK